MSRESLKVLVVEDDFFVRIGVIKILKTLGHNVVGDAESGEIGLIKTKKLNPDIILMDIKMNGMSGIEASSHIQAQCPTPIIFLTAHETPEFVELASNAGAAAYLIKPPKAADIDRALCVAMARHRETAKLRQSNETLTLKTTVLEKTLAEIKPLEKILPICCHCKKIRDEKGLWNQVETYIEKQTGTRLTHGICNECMIEHHNVSPPENPPR